MAKRLTLEKKVCLKLNRKNASQLPKKALKRKLIKIKLRGKWKKNWKTCFQNFRKKLQDRNRVSQFQTKTRLLKINPQKKVQMMKA